MSSVLNNKFRGAIAGSILGYCFGLHYASIYQSEASLKIGYGLDWSWLASQNPTCSPISNVPPASNPPAINPLASNASVQYLNILTQLFTIGLAGNDHHLIRPTDSSVINSNDSVVPLESMLNVLSFLLMAQKTSLMNAQEENFSGAFTSSPKSTIEAVLMLLPVLLLYHDDVPRQQQQIEQWQLALQLPKSWLSTFDAIGAMVGQAVRSHRAEQYNPNSLMHWFQTDTNLHSFHPNVHGYHKAPISGGGVLHISGGYELTILSLLYFSRKALMDWSSLPLIMGITGALAGSQGGFTRLPLVWRHSMNIHWQELRSQSLRGQGLSQNFCPPLTPDWSTGLLYAWSGCERTLPLGTSARRPTLTTDVARTIP